MAAAIQAEILGSSRDDTDLSRPNLMALGPFGGHFARAWPQIAEFSAKHWGRAVVKAQLVTGWSVLFRLQGEGDWRLKTWCDSYQSHLWGCADDRIVQEMGEALNIGSREVAVRWLERRKADDGSGRLQQPLRWVRERLHQIGEGIPPQPDQHA